MNLFKTTINNEKWVLINLDNVKQFIEDYINKKVIVEFVDNTSTVIDEEFEDLEDELMD